MQEQSAQAENELWNAVGEVLDTEMSTVAVSYTHLRAHETA